MKHKIKTIVSILLLLYFIIVMLNELAFEYYIKDYRSYIKSSDTINDFIEQQYGNVAHIYAISRKDNKISIMVTPDITFNDLDMITRFIDEHDENMTKVIFVSEDANDTIMPEIYSIAVYDLLGSRSYTLENTDKYRDLYTNIYQEDLE